MGIGLLIWLLVVLVVVLICKAIVDALELEPNVRKIVYLILGLLALIWLVGQLGAMGPGYMPYR